MKMEREEEDDEEAEDEFLHHLCGHLRCSNRAPIPTLLYLHIAEMNTETISTKAGGT